MYIWYCTFYMLVFIWRRFFKRRIKQEKLNKNFLLLITERDIKCLKCMKRNGYDINIAYLSVKMSLWWGILNIRSCLRSEGWSSKLIYSDVWCKHFDGSWIGIISVCFVDRLLYSRFYGACWHGRIVKSFVTMKLLNFTRAEW